MRYCSKDVVSLYQILEKFSVLIYLKYNLNITSSSTLPSLAYKIYRTHSLPHDVEYLKTTDKKGKEVIKRDVQSHINDITIKEFTELKQAYYGGHVDMYIPSNKEKIYHYDVNSLYPAAMKQFKFPTKLFARFIGNIKQMENYSTL
uniref:DNA-directed DNA polymerase n=1 Tax=Coniferiporia sulphurascens TaxID=175648 RepID=A0A5B9R9Y0_CONSH|nr:DNA polymerase family B [Coniferiporia sulphurascens]QEG57192.1 DNA polymerase family B [Coniferiporia sulphurascens]